MNMIPLVMANEPGRAQIVNLHSVPNCSLEMHHWVEAWCKSCWKTASERVRIPYSANASRRQCVFLESRTLEVVR